MLSLLALCHWKAQSTHKIVYYIKVECKRTPMINVTQPYITIFIKSKCYLRYWITHKQFVNCFENKCETCISYNFQHYDWKGSLIPSPGSCILVCRLGISLSSICILLCLFEWQVINCANTMRDTDHTFLKYTWGEKYILYWHNHL